MQQHREAVAAVLGKRRDYREAWDYYEGNVAETFATAKLRRAFASLGDRSRLNYCRPVINAVSNRIEIASVSGANDRARSIINSVWVNNEMMLEANEIHRNTLVYGDTYALVWPDDDGEWQIAYHSPEDMALVYDPESPRKKLYAVKIWKPEEHKTRMNVYHPDRIEKYVADAGDVTEGTMWRTIEVEENPFGAVPVFHFRTHRPYGRPEHKDAYDAQNSINKLFITNMFTIDYQGAPQRYALSQMDGGEATDFEEDGLDRENIGALRNGPGELWYLKGVHSVGEFKPADPNVFWGPIEKTVRAIASLTDTPLHYFEKANNIQSGQGLRSAEAPLLKKVGDRQIAFAATWREMFQFILTAEGVAKSDVQIFWRVIESLDEVERWDVALKKINAGLSRQQALREGGYSEEQIEKIRLERAEEDAAGENEYARSREPDRAVRMSTNANENNTVDTTDLTKE